MKKLSSLIIISCLTLGAHASLLTSQQISMQLRNNTIDSVHNDLRAGNLTCENLINAYLERIKKYDLDLSRGAPINAFVALNPNLINEARALDNYYQTTGHFMGALHCIPVIVKDNVDTQNTPSTSGSLSLLGSQPTTDAFLVTKIKNAGGIIIGKGAMDEFASGMSGISSKSGRVGNAIDPMKNPGGSSAGSAAAVSANFAIIGIGSDNSGSVRIPAVFNGLSGIRPSTGIISQTGIFPRGSLDGVAGVISKNIKDMAITMSVIANSSDPKDPKTMQPTNRVSSYLPYLTANALKGRKIGIITQVNQIKTFDKNNKEAMQIFNQTFENFKQLGANLVEIKLPKFDNDRKNNMAGEVEDINNYLAAFPSTRKNYQDICTSNRTRVFKSTQACLRHINDTAAKDSAIYQQVLTRFANNRAYVQKVMKDNHLDTIIIPLNAAGGVSYNVKQVNTGRAPVSSNSGLPAITIIGGYTNDKPAMPVGLELIGKMYSEGDLMGLAYSYEISFPKQPLPYMPQLNKPSPLENMSIEQINNFLTMIGYQTYKQILQDSPEQTINTQQFVQIIINMTNGYLKSD